MKRLLLAISLIAGTIAAYTSCEEQEQTPEIVKVESVSIDQEDMTLTEGESVTLTATVLPEDAADKTITWSSSNDDIVLIASNGKAKAMSLGKAVITAKAGDKTDFITITVSAKVIPVTGISLTPSSITMKVGETQSITAEVTPQDATDKSVTWESSNPEVATVNDGTVVGINPGSVTITATTVYGGKTAECTVTIKANLAPSVTVAADHISAVSAVLSGEANLTSSMAADMTMGIMYSLNSAVLPSNSTKISTNDINLKQGYEASYCYSVNVTGLTPNTTYYYRSYVNQSGQDTYGETKEFTTKDIPSMLETYEATEIEATKATLNGKLDLTDAQYENMSYGFYYGLSAETQDTPLNGGEVVENAFASALENLPHKTQYWYKAFVKLDDQTLFGEVKTFTTGVVLVNSITFDKTEFTFHTIGNTLALTATVLPEDATDKALEWTTSNDYVATVTSNGIVRAVGNGSATIMAIAKDGSEVYATCVITVEQFVTSITLDKTDFTLIVGETEPLTATVIPDNANSKSVIWSSSDEAVATVNQNGIVTAVSKGWATITATAADENKASTSCSLRVMNGACPEGAVDLGLSVYWAKCNLGATKPEQYGAYYAWGEIEPKTDYSWSSYEFGNSKYGPFSKYNTDSSYGTVDNKTVLDPEDDAAHMNLGGNWRLPTDEEWTELRENCTWTWTTENGVNGYQVKGPNGNSISLPAAGYQYETELRELAGSYGGYWSASLSPYVPYGACVVEFNSDNCEWGERWRCDGRSIRPVCE